MVDGKSCHDGLSSTWDAWTEQRTIFRPIPFLELRVLQEPLSSTRLMSIDEVPMLDVIVDGADPLQQVMLQPYSGLIQQDYRVALDLGSGFYDHGRV